MKKVTLMFAILFLAVLVNAQDEGQPRDDFNTVFGKSGNIKLGWYIGIDAGYTRFDSRDVWLGGLSAGMVINHAFTIGGWGRGITNPDRLYYPNATDTVGAYLTGGYGGLLLEYTLFPKSVIHVTFPIMIGGGSATYTTDKEYWQFDDEGNSENSHTTLDKDDFFVFEPGVRAELNIVKFMRLTAGISYRYTAGVDLINTSGTFMNNFTGTIGLKFGKF